MGTASGESLIRRNSSTRSIRFIGWCTARASGATDEHDEFGRLSALVESSLLPFSLCSRVERVFDSLRFVRLSPRLLPACPMTPARCLRVVNLRFFRRDFDGRKFQITLSFNHVVRISTKHQGSHRVSQLQRQRCQYLPHLQRVSIFALVQISKLQY